MLTRRDALLTLLAVPVVAATELSPEPDHAFFVDVGALQPDDAVAFVNQIREEMGARFEVVSIDPEGSGMDWLGHLGRVVTRGQRCCENCSIIIATLGHPDNKWEVGFTTRELRPLNAEAQTVLDEIADFKRKRFPLMSATREMFRRVLPDGSVSKYNITTSWALDDEPATNATTKGIEYRRYTETWERPRGIDHLSHEEIRAQLRLVERIDHNECFVVIDHSSAERLQELGIDGHAVMAGLEHDANWRVVCHPEDWSYTMLRRRA